MSAHRSVTAALFVAVITALLFVVLAYSPATPNADAQTASAAPTTKVGLTTRAAPCGFSRLRQTWRNCKDNRYYINVNWVETVTGNTGTTIKCVRQGTTYLYRVIPFGTLAVTAYKLRRSC